MAENASSQLELYRVHGNHLGVPVVTTNAAGQVVTPGNDFLRPGFPGQSEVLADLYYNRARDYDPITGRYIQADPFGLMGDVNPYVYAGADPVNMIDPDGLVARELGGALLLGGTNLGYQLYNNGGWFECVDWWVVGGWALSGTGLGGISRIGIGRFGWKSAPRGSASNPASNIADGAKLREHLRQLEKYGQRGFKQLQNGRNRYYGNVKPARNPGEMAGRRTVREWNPANGRTRTWHETLDHAGRVRQVRPQAGGNKRHHTFDANGTYTGTWP